MAVFTQRLLARQTFRHRFVTVDNHRQQTALGLQPYLVKIFLQRAAHTQAIEEYMRVRG